MNNTKGKWKRRMGGLLLVFLFLLGSLLQAPVAYAQEEPPEALFVGDDMILEMEKVSRDPTHLFFGESDKGLTWLKDNAKKIIDMTKKEMAVFIHIGFKEIKNTYQAEAYAEYINELAESLAEKEATVYYVSINPVNEEKYRAQANEKIDAWNQVMDENLSEYIRYLDTNRLIQELGYETTNNGFLYTEESTKALYDLLLREAGLLTLEEKERIHQAEPVEIKTTNGWGTDVHGVRVYYDAEGEIVKDQMLEIDGGKYLFDENGYYKTGLQTYDARNYFFNSAGVMRGGWVKDDEGWMLFSEEGPQLFGWHTYDGNTYYIGKSGYRLTDWWTLGTTLHYFHEDGAAASGMTAVGTNTYFFNHDGSVRVGWVEHEGNTYFFGDGGVMYVGKEAIGGDVYFFADDGKMHRGWRAESDGNRYYDDTGAMVTGWTEISGQNYLFDEGGLLQTGEVTTPEGETVFLSKDGTLANGIETIDEKKMLYKDGVPVGGWYEDTDGTKYFFDANGEMATGWRTIGEDKYYFDEDGAYYTGVHKFDGSTYHFSDSGVLERSMPNFVKPLIVLAVLAIGVLVFVRLNRQRVYDWAGQLIVLLSKEKEEKPKVKKAPQNKTNLKEKGAGLFSRFKKKRG